MPRKHPTDEDRVEAIRIVLAALSDDSDPYEIAGPLYDLHPRYNTFPGEVFLEMAADVLALGPTTRDSPIRFEGLVSTYLPECDFRRRDAYKMRTAILLAASLHGGLEPDMFDDVARWQTDDYWRYALFALVAFVRATAEQRGVSVSEIADELARLHDVELS